MKPNIRTGVGVHCMNKICRLCCEQHIKMLPPVRISEAEERNPYGSDWLMQFQSVYPIPWQLKRKPKPLSHNNSLSRQDGCCWHAKTDTENQLWLPGHFFAPHNPTYYFVGSVWLVSCGPFTILAYSANVSLPKNVLLFHAKIYYSPPIIWMDYSSLFAIYSICYVQICAAAVLSSFVRRLYLGPQLAFGQLFLRRK